VTFISSVTGKTKFGNGRRAFEFVFFGNPKNKIAAMVKKTMQRFSHTSSMAPTGQPSLASAAAANADSEFKMQQLFSEWTSVD
jgi:hypothetical protein